MHVRVTIPPVPIIDLADAKKHLRVDHDDDDDLISSLVDAATAWIDGPAGWLGRSIGPQTIEARLDTIDDDEIVLPFGPIIAITSVKYLDTDGDEQTLATSVYQRLSDGRIVLNADEAWPDLFSDHEAVRVVYVAGYGTLNEDDEVIPAIPAPLKAAILLMTSYLYNNREASPDAAIGSGAVQFLLVPYRVWSV